MFRWCDGFWISGGCFFAVMGSRYPDLCVLIWTRQTAPGDSESPRLRSTRSIHEAIPVSCLPCRLPDEGRHSGKTPRYGELGRTEEDAPISQGTGLSEAAQRQISETFPHLPRCVRYPTNKTRRLGGERVAKASFRWIQREVDVSRCFTTAWPNLSSGRSSSVLFLEDSRA